MEQFQSITTSRLRCIPSLSREVCRTRATRRAWRAEDRREADDTSTSNRRSSRERLFFSSPHQPIHAFASIRSQRPLTSLSYPSRISAPRSLSLFTETYPPFPSFIPRVPVLTLHLHPRPGTPSHLHSLFLRRDPRFALLCGWSDRFLLFFPSLSRIPTPPSPLF